MTSPADPGSGSFREGSPLLDEVYEQLRAIARQRMSAEGPGHTLQPTALVHEAFLRIGQGRRIPFRDRAHFFAAAAEAMRRILIDHARAKGAAKRTPGARPPHSVLDLAENAEPAEILALDEALQRLEGVDSEVAAVVRLRFFAGLSVDQVAETLRVSPRQVDRLWSYARAWLAREMRRAE